MGEAGAETATEALRASSSDGSDIDGGEKTIDRGDSGESSRSAFDNGASEASEVNIELTSGAGAAPDF